MNNENYFDVIVVGAGHAGCEAALASSRRGFKTLILTISLDKIAYMSCNPAIGGLAKGNLVRDLDALGGEMAKNIDATAIQFQILNQRKGAATRASRAQADKREYSNRMCRVLFAEKTLSVKQAVVSDILAESGKVAGAKTMSGEFYYGKKVIVATGTFLNGKIYVGDRCIDGGRMNDIPSTELVQSINSLGFEPIRLKTGTPARLDKRTIDFSVLDKYKVEKGGSGFSFETVDRKEDQIDCYITYTNPETHKIVRDNMNRSLYYNNPDKALGPRYCPSMEDKVTKFASRDRHQLILEQEGLDSCEIYANGFSSSLPTDAQVEAYRTIKGLEQVEFIRPAYAIEYVAYQPTILKQSYETKIIDGLYFAGQINGTSGYEEAAVQGFMAGINATLSLQNLDPLILRRDESYIGVMTDDLTTRGIDEPYRIFSSRAEYRLRLREDNAERRLLKYGNGLGLISNERYARFLNDEELVRAEIERLRTTALRLDKPSRPILEEHGITLNEGMTCYNFLKRPEASYELLQTLGLGNNIDERLINQIEIEIAYKGYIDQEDMDARGSKIYELRKIPNNIDYKTISGLRREHIERLEKIRPTNLGQAMRINGITLAAINILDIAIAKWKKDAVR